LELALAAGRAVGCDTVEELMLQAPLVLTPESALQLQVALGEPDEDGHRQVDIYSRPQEPAEAVEGEARAAGGGWTRHASGILLADAHGVADVERLGLQWPPAGAQQLDVEFLYDRMAEAGFSYGPVFQGVQAAWREGEAIYAEIALPEDTTSEAAQYGIHPALLDAALHTALLEWGEQLNSDGQVLPFSLSGVTLWRTGAAVLRVRLMRDEGTALSLATFDEVGEPVLSMSSLALRPVEKGLLQQVRTRSHDSLYRMEWVEVAMPPAAEAQPQQFALLGDLRLAGVEGEPYADLAALTRALESGAPPPDVVFVAQATDHTNLAQAARAGTQRMIELLQAWLACPQLADAQLVLVTSGAVAVGAEQTPDLVSASLWGLLRSAQAEHPGCFAIVDRDPDAGDEALVDGVGWRELLVSGEPQLAVRGGNAYAPRAAALETAATLLPPAGEDCWALAAGGGGTFDDLALVASERARLPLGAQEVRIAVHAAGLNFRDVWVSLGIGQERGHTTIGTEGAGVVLEVGEGVEDLAPGDRVMGLMQDAFGPVTVSERELLVRIPDGWSFVQAAAVPSVFLTAYYALVDLAELQPGESLLIHAAAGGVGMAALQLARHLGAEVFATASPAKAGVLAELGLDPEHVGSSRDLEFEQAFLRASDGRGVDVVLNSLTREFIDASLGLLPRGGRFLEMGKTELRDAEQVAREHPGVRYRAFDVPEAGSARIQEMLQTILGLFEQGVLTHLPLTTWDVRRAEEALRFMREARHVGKIVLTIPQRPDPEGTVLITGGTGVLGALVARHLAAVHGAKRLLLVSRRGSEAEGAVELVGELAELGCQADVVACDMADRDRAAELIDSIAAEHPLTSVIHAAGVLDDGVLAMLTPEQVERAMRPKVDAALNLHELTDGMELAEFIMFSSAAGVFGSAGQGAYAAANTFLDALADARRAQGLAGQSLAWGFWEQVSGMTGVLGEAGRERLKRMGVLTLPNGPELFDVARSAYDALVLPVRLDMAALRSQASAGTLSPVLRQLVRGAGQRERASAGSLARELAGVPEAEREATVLRLVCAHAASVLGHGSAQAIDQQRAFKELGFDSLSAVELRNRLARATGLRLPSTLIFDYPNAAAVADYLIRKVNPDVATPAGDDAGEVDIRRVLASIPIVRLRESGLYEQLVKLAGSGAAAALSAAAADHDAAIDEMDTETLVRMTFGTDETTGGDA
jgi:polyketide synthase 12